MTLVEFSRPIRDPDLVSVRRKVPLVSVEGGLPSERAVFLLRPKSTGDPSSDRQ